MNVALYIARRYIVSKKSTNAINIISWISVVAIAFGTAALIIIMSGMNGLTNLVQTLYNSFDSDIEISTQKGKHFLLNEKQLNAIRSVEGVHYLLPIIEDNALLKYGDRQTISKVKGVSNEYIKMTGMDTLISEGVFSVNQKNASSIVLGKGVSYRLGVSLSDYFSAVHLFSPKRGGFSAINPEEAFEEIQAYPIGNFSINDEFDYNYVFISIKQARELFGLKEKVSSYEIGLKQTADLESVQNKIKEILGKDFKVKNKFEQNEILFKTLKSEKLWTFLILSFILVVATFNIIGALTMLIIEKKKDINILMHLGADYRLIRRIFMSEGFLITFIGALIGMLTGLVLCWIQKHYPFITFDGGFVVEAYPVKVEWKDFFAILALVMFIGFFAAWYPVRRFTSKKSIH